MKWATELLDLGSVVGIGRIAFGGMFLVKQYFSIDAHRLNWAHGRPTVGGSEWPFRVCLYALFCATACFTSGLFAGPAALLQWLLYIYLYRYASIYGMEDNIFHGLGLYFVFSGAGSSLSLDRVLGLQTWSRYPADSVLPELAVATLFGIIFLSAGLGKISSPMWRRGLGVYCFFVLPLHRRLDTSLLTSRRLLMTVLNYLVLGLQVVVLPAFLVNAFPLGLGVWVLLFGFAVTLSTVFVFTWLGESLVVGLMVILWLLLDSGNQGLGTRWIEEITSLDSPLEYVYGGVLLLTLFACLWSAAVPHLFPQLGSRAAKVLSQSLRTMARYIWGFLPVDLFSEKHTRGPVVYRTFFQTDQGQEHEVFRIFLPNCQVGPDRLWRPTFIEVTQYKVAEACMEMDLYGEVRTPQRLRFLLQLAQYIGSKASGALGRNPVSMLFRTLQLVPPRQYAGADAWYLNEPWVDAFCVEFRDGRAREVRVLSRPILKAPTGRDISRLSFQFDAASE